MLLQREEHCSIGIKSSEDYRRSNIVTIFAVIYTANRSPKEHSDHSDPLLQSSNDNVAFGILAGVQDLPLQPSYFQNHISQLIHRIEPVVQEIEKLATVDLIESDEDSKV